MAMLPSEPPATVRDTPRTSIDRQRLIAWIALSLFATAAGQLVADPGVRQWWLILGSVSTIAVMASAVRPAVLRAGGRKALGIGSATLLTMSMMVWPSGGDTAHAAVASCPGSPGDTTGSGPNLLSLGNGTTVSPCIADAPIHMVIGVKNGGAQFTTDGVSFPDGTYSYCTDYALGVCWSSHSAPSFQTLQLADGSRTAGPVDVKTETNSGVGGASSTLYADKGWAVGGPEDDDAQLIHLRLRNLKITKSVSLSVAPQSSVTDLTSAGTGAYQLTFSPETAGAAGWNLGDSDSYVDMWVRADGYLQTNILGISSSLADLSTNSLLSSIATLNGLSMQYLDVWVYYVNANIKAGATGQTPLKLPSTDIEVTQ